MRDPDFQGRVIAFAAQLKDELMSDSFKASFEEQMTRYQELFGIENFGPKQEPLTLDVLVERLNLTVEELQNRSQSWRKNTPPVMPDSERFIATAFFESQDQYANHLTVFYFPDSAGEGRLVIRNITPYDIEPRRLYFSGKKRRREDFDLDVINLPPATQDTAAITHEIAIPDQLLAEKGDLILEYAYRGDLFEHTVSVQFEHYDSGFSDTPIEALEAVLGANQIDRTKQEISIVAGRYVFTESIEAPIGWRMRIMPGAELNFEQGSLLKLRGALDIEGTENNPVIVNVETDLAFRDMGAWGGIFVSKAADRSTVRHLVLTGTGAQNLNTRQGFYGMTGCFSFFESDVTISHSEFNSTQCEDALNIVKSDFVLDDVTISKARADAFDSDFSTGVIKDSLFLDSGNDGVDVSGTSLRMERVRMEGIGDKAVSVGEKSVLFATQIEINGAVLGVASKDLSRATVEQSRFDNIVGTALMTYIKKAEYGASSIDCQNCSFGEIGAVTGRQEGTQIIVNGREDRRGYLTQQQVIDAGLAETG